MKSPQIRLLAIGPFLATAMATSAIAQEAVMANPTAAVETKVSVASVQTDTVVIPLKVNIPEDGTYVFTAPANTPITLSLDGSVILSVPEISVEGAEPFRVITSLTAGDHLIELEGADLTVEQVALISMYEMGSEPVSIANSATAISEEEAEVLVASVANSVGSETESTADGTQVASANTARQPFLIGGGSADKVSAAAASTETTSGAGTMSAGGNAVQVASANTAQPDTTSSGGGSTSTQPAATAGGGGAVTGSSGGSFPTPAPTPGTPAGGGGTPTPPAPPVVPPAPPVVPPVIPANMARASALTPPTNVTLTQAVQITGGASEAGVVSNSGQTLFGQVMDPVTFDIVNAVIAPSGRETTVDVGASTGQFAVRLFPEDLTLGEATVTITGASSANSEVTSVPVEYVYQAGIPSDGLTQALSRMTNGATPELYARVREIGFENFVNEQLNPDAINDAAFNAMNFDRMLRRDDVNQGAILERLFRHNFAHSAFSQKQLQDVMGDFWNNHFHAATKNGRVVVQNIDDRQFFRENAFGSFEDMLLYSARSPLMSQFLDNNQSRGSNDPDNRAARLNENYGREILELHTVGVDGGYTAEDVIQVSLVFTGWNHRQTNPDANDEARTYEFEFRAGDHDSDDKTIPFLATTITGRSGAEGVQEGEELIAILADDPRTHNYVCGKIVQRLVADTPPANFVQTCVAAWQATDGDMGEVVRAILTAPEFITTVELQRAKGKTPYEYAVSVIRALGMRPDSSDDEGGFFDRFIEASQSAGYDPHSFLVPTGMPEVGSAWTSSAAMIGKYNELTDVVERANEYNFDIAAEIRDAGLETAEEVAGYLLSIATADRFAIDEYESMVAVLKGEDGIFEPLTQDESAAFSRAVGLLVVLPSFQLQ